MCTGIRPRDDNARKSLVPIRLSRVVDPDFILKEVDDEFNCSARQNPHPWQGRHIKAVPKVVDEVPKRCAGW